MSEQKIFQSGRPVIYGLVTFLACVTSTTLGHYADFWASGYFVGGMFAVMSSMLISIIDN